MQEEVNSFGVMQKQNVTLSYVSLSKYSHYCKCIISLDGDKSVSSE